MAEHNIVAEIIKAVAAVDGVDPAELDPLYDYINPKALEALCEREQGEWCLTFQFSDHQIVIDHNFQIRVDGVIHSPDASSRFET